MAFELVDLTENLPSPYLDKYEPTKGTKDYAFICSTKKGRTEIHYSDELKMSWHCFGGSCCKVFPKKTSYTIYLIAQYVSGRNSESSLVLKYLKAGRQLDDSIRAIAEQFEDESGITKIDLCLELDKSKSEKFKLVKITPCMDGKRKAGKEALIELKSQIKEAMGNLAQSVAQVITEEQFQKICEENNIDIEEAEQETQTKSLVGKKKAKPEPEEVEEEPEEIEEDEAEEQDTILGEDEVPFGDDDVEVEDEEIEEKPAPKKTAPTKKPAPKKAEPEEVDDSDFNIDDLL